MLLDLCAKAVQVDSVHAVVGDALSSKQTMHSKVSQISRHDSHTPQGKVVGTFISLFLTHKDSGARKHTKAASKTVK
jgi:hypothetical protein